MAYNKNDKADGAKFKRGGMRRRKKSMRILRREERRY